MCGERRQLLPIRRQRRGRLRTLNLLFQVADDALTIVADELGELHPEPKNSRSFRLRPRLAVAYEPAGMNLSPWQGEHEASPEPTLNISPLMSDPAALTKASATSVTKVKSRVCVPSPTTVNDFPLSF